MTKVKDWLNYTQLFDIMHFGDMWLTRHLVITMELSRPAFLEYTLLSVYVKMFLPSELVTGVCLSRHCTIILSLLEGNVLTSALH